MPPPPQRNKLEQRLLVEHTEHTHRLNAAHAAEMDAAAVAKAAAQAHFKKAMLSLLLTPFSVLVTMLVWSYLPKELRVPNGLLQISSRLNPRGQNLLSAPETHDEGDADAVRT